MTEKPEELSDEALATLVQGNNHEAFGVLMDRYQGRLVRYGRRFLVQTDPIEDVVQGVFIKAYENIKSFDTTRRFSPWIYRIAHNAFLDTIRKRKGESVSYVDFDTFVAHPSHERDTEGEEEEREMKALVDTGLAALPPHYREALVLYYLESLSYQEIADVLHVPLGTVGVRLRRAREALKRYVGEPPPAFL